MSKTRIVITEASLTETGILITEMKVIHGASGNDLRIAKITPELLEFLKMVEIGVDDYFAILKAKEQQPEFRKLIENFKLYT
jgi:hypothetical protein